jgi:hypothetical protein
MNSNGLVRLVCCLCCAVLCCCICIAWVLIDDISKKLMDENACKYLSRVGTLVGQSALKPGQRLDGKLVCHLLTFFFNFEYSDFISSSQISVWDIEDFVKLGESCDGCPYFGARELMESVDVVFCPYNYIIDPRIRKASGIDLEVKISTFACACASVVDLLLDGEAVG